MFKSLINRVKKGIRDIGSFAGDNPLITAGAAMLGLPALTGGLNLSSLLGGGGGILDIGKNLLFGKDTFGGEYGKNKHIPGILDIGKKIISGVGEGGVTDLLISGYMAKQAKDEMDRIAALEEQREREEWERWNYLNNLWGPTGGSPYIDDQYRDLAYNVSEGTVGDRVVDGKIVDFTEDEEGRAVLPSASGGIAQLNMGGVGQFGGTPHSPFNPNNIISGKLPVRRAQGGTMNGSSGIDPQIFDPRMSGKQMMNEIKENPGITQFFPPKFGEIRGPGGPKDDKIPAMLSDGEFVFTAKAVDNAGGPKAMYNMMNKLDPESSKGRGIIS